MVSERFPINVRNERHKLQQAFLGTSERVNVSFLFGLTAFLQKLVSFRVNLVLLQGGSRSEQSLSVLNAFE